MRDGLGSGGEEREVMYGCEEVELFLDLGGVGVTVVAIGTGGGGRGRRGDGFA
jgi:hypothetical protein